jgi:translation initiation factor 2 beta subunit (eIF-2beta)/eIF-5
MKFKLEVGEEEKHVVEFCFNQLAGTLVITVDDKPVVKKRRLINEPIEETYELTVGENIKSSVRIEKRRKQLLGHRSRVWINNRLAQVANNC